MATSSGGGTGRVNLGSIDDGGQGYRLTKAGPGVLSVTGLGTYSGGTLVSAGTVIANNPGSLGTGTVTLANGTLLRPVFGGQASSLSGFGDSGTGWTLNGGPSIASDVLTITDSNNNEARSAYFNTAQPIFAGSSGFTASFTYTNGGNKTADGAAFVLQNQGLNAVGNGGGGLGFQGVAPSVGFLINIYAGHQIGTTLAVGTSAVQDFSGTYDATLPIADFSNGDPINVTLAYDPVGQSVKETLLDTLNNDTFTKTFTGFDLASILGSNTALVGFTGGTGGANATQTFSDFSYQVGIGAAYSNAVAISGGASATIDVPATADAATLTMGGLTVNHGGTATLNVLTSSAPTDSAYGLTLAATALNSNLVVNVANNGAGAGTLTLGAVSDPTGTYGLTKTGAGVLVLAGVNSYHGSTTVAAGTLRLAGGSSNNIPASPLITVGGGATLDVTGLAAGTLALGAGGPQTLSAPASGIGTIDGALSVADGSAISGGSGAALDFTGGLTLAGGSFSSFALTPAGANNSGNPLVSLAGTLTGPASGEHTLNFTGTAAAGTYDLYNYAASSVSLGQFTLGTHPVGNFMYTLAVSGTEIDLTVAAPASNAAWNVNAGGSYNLNTNWNPANVPSGAGLIATFGNGVSTAVNAPSLTVAIDAPAVVGGLVFDNSNGTNYVLGNGGGGLTLGNSGLGSTVSVAASGIANPTSTIYANLILADNATIDVAASNTFTLSTSGSPATIGESGGSHSLTKTGPGTLIIDRPSSYTGGTIVSNGVLTVTAGGSSLGSGPLEVDGAAGNTAVVNLNSSQSVAGLSGSVSGGSAHVNVAAEAMLSDIQASDATFAGALALAGGPSTAGAAQFTKLGAAKLTIASGLSLGDNSQVNIDAGTLKLANSGPATIGAAVTVNVNNAATLELAGSVSALSTGTTPANRAAIVNDSTAAAGVLISGPNQQTGPIEGPGTVQVNAGASLTADFITAGALVIEGDATDSAIVSIAASDTSGNPLAESSSFVLAGSLASTAPSAGGTLGSSSLSMADVPSSSGTSSTESSLAAPGAGGGAASVPEPSSLLLLALGCLGCLLHARRRRR